MMKRLIMISVFILPMLSHAAAGDKHHHHGSGKHHEHKSLAGEPVVMGSFDRVIEVDLLDSMRFKFAAEPEIKAGESIKFVVRNQGNVPHEFSIGTAEEHEKHRIMMQNHHDMHHTDGNTVTVAPGETETLIWKFGNLASVIAACNIPGHFEAGMNYTLELQVPE